MANSTIGALTAITGANTDGDSDSLALFDNSAGNTRKIAPRELLSGSLWPTTLTVTSNITLTGTLSVSSTLAVTGTSTLAAVNASAAVNANLTTDATSISTGSLLTAGGLGVTKALWVGGLMNVAGAVTLQSTLTVAGAVTLQSTLTATGVGTFNGGLNATLADLGANTGQLVLKKSDGTLTTDGTQLSWDSASDVMSINGLTLNSTRVSGPADNTFGSNGQTGLTVSNTANVNATLNGGLTCGSGSYTAGAALTFGRILKSVTGITDAVATDTITVTIPNAAHSASLKLTLKGSLGAGGAIGANEATGTISYDVAIARTAGVATVAVASTAYGSATAAVAGAATITITAAVSAISGAVGATQTFTITTTISRGTGASTNHTCQVLAEVINANASGVSIA